ncbi:MAG: tRNA (guanosine(46)-N7)-methyltransferase TrmB [Termitinemataceae bacterium]|nr:MAG: tRNA (guanosine(46)-N7)-methyltransferase TrmB [Termitinemataceae bacterium]
MEKEQHYHLKSFVLRGGRMTKAQEKSYNLAKDSFCIPLCDTPLDLQKIFGNDNPVTIEIGFGTGEATAAYALQNPACNYLGIEVFKAGIGKLLWRIEQDGIKNIRIIEGDAVDVLAKMIANASVSAFHIFFPDPWPKKRHHKRRLVQRPFTNLLCEKLCRGGDTPSKIHFATDIEDYAHFAFAELEATEGLIKGCENFAQRGSRPQTKFERKGVLSKRQIFDIIFYKV